MFEALFTFRGRINRLQYFAGAMGIALAGIVLLVLLFLMGAGALTRAAAAGAHPAPGAGLLVIGLAALIAAPMFLWISFSLQARRFRDMGWSPVYVIPAWIVVQIFDGMVARVAPALAVSPAIHNTPVGLLISLALSLALLFWPGRAEDEIDDRSTPSATPDRPAPRTPSPAIPAATGRPAAPAAAGGFGRRGV